MIKKNQLVHQINLAVHPTSLREALFFLTVLTNRAGRRSEGVPHAGRNEAAVPSQPVLFWFSYCGGV